MTDANVVIGRLGANKPLGRDIKLSAAAAKKAVGRLAASLRIDVREMAEGIIRLAVANTTSAIREISVMRGHDPRDFTLFAFGGAGPLHAAIVAEELEMKRVAIPPYPGNFSAFGLLTADSRAEGVIALNRPLAGPWRETICELIDRLSGDCRARLEQDAGAKGPIIYAASADLRYARQASYLNLPIPDGGIDAEAFEVMFIEEYRRQYGHIHPDPIELCNIRVSARRRNSKPNPARRRSSGSPQ